MVALTPKAIELAKDGNTEPATLTVRDVAKLPNGKYYSCVLTDGSAHTMKARLVSSVSKALADGSMQLKDGDIVTVGDYVCNNVAGEHLLMVSSLELLQSNPNSTAAANGSSTDAAGAKADQGVAVQEQKVPGTPLQAVKQEAGGHVTPAAVVAKPLANLTPGPIPSPSEELKQVAMTPATTAGGPRGVAGTPPAPMSASPLPVSNRAGVQPIAALNPYDTNWCIKAKVVRKAPPRSFNSRGGAPSRVFNVELADAMGTQIQATFWRESVDKYLDSLQEGKVYYFSKFQVKVANKQYATVKNDYELHFDQRTEIEEAADQGGISVSHQLDLVPLDKLPRHVGRKMPVDVLGVVMACGQLGTIKRKADSRELVRRDVTIADSSCSSVVLTLWGDQAQRADLDNCEGQLLQVTSVRVGDYNGCSLSAVTRSQVTLNPEGPEADALRQWWESEGRSAAITPLGQGGGGGGGAGAGAGRGNKLQFLSDVMVEENLPSPDAKPSYHDVIVSVMQVKDDQTMYYLANPENGKKVEPRDGRFWCEGESRYVDAAQHRYVITARVADATREAYVNMFNDQGVQLLGSTADELAAMRSNGDEDGLARTIKAAKWSEWAMTLAARSREYNGERRMRYTVVRMSPVDYAQEGHRLLQLIQQSQC